MQIKECEIKDLERLSVIFDNYRQRYKQASAVDKIRAYLAERLENKQTKIYLAQDELGEINGFSLLYPSFSSIGLAKIWVLNDFFVCSGQNKKLVADSLMQKSLDLCSETGAIRLEVTTRKENHRLHRLYKDFGFERDYKYDYYYLGMGEDAKSSDSATRVLK